MGAFSEQDLINLGYQVIDGRAVRRNGSGRALAAPPAHERQSGNGLVAPPTPKYRNKPCCIGHEKFDSQHEANRWLELGLRQQAGDIIDLKRQVRFDLHAPVGRGSILAPIGYYVADFTWRDGKCPTCGVNVSAANPTRCVPCHLDIPLHVADAKGGKATQTQLFLWKARHLAIEYGLTVEIL